MMSSFVVCSAYSTSTPVSRSNPLTTDFGMYRSQFDTTRVPPSGAAVPVPVPDAAGSDDDVSEAHAAPAIVTTDVSRTSVRRIGPPR